MNIPSEDIKDLLEGESALALVFGTNLFIGLEPTDPSNCVTIFDYSGELPQRVFDSSVYDKPAVNIRVRNIDYITGLVLAQDIKDLLHNRGNENVNGTYYSYIGCSSGPAFIDWDENHRARFSVNFIIHRR